MTTDIKKETQSFPEEMLRRRASDDQGQSHQKNNQTNPETDKTPDQRPKEQ